MPALYGSRKSFEPPRQNGITIISSVALLTLCLLFRPAEANNGDEISVSKWTSTYQFLADKSTITQTGGIAGVHWTYRVEGQFLLTVNSEAGTAAFARVDANAVDDSPEHHTLDPNEVFNMTELAGVIIDRTTIQFEGAADDGSSVQITLTFTDDTVALKGQTTPLPNSADFFIFALDAIAKRKYSGGTGEPNDPYLIYTPEQMNTIGTEPNDWDKHFRLMNDLDLSGVGLENPIGRPYGKPFTGVFEGNERAIINFVPTYKSLHTGLFAHVSGAHAEIRNLSLIDPNVHGGSYVGGLVGHIGEGAIRGCAIIGGSINGTDHVGGLVGRAWYSVIEGCTSSASVVGRNDVGGLVGVCYNETLITNCGATWSVNGKDEVGGLVGGCGGSSKSGDCIIAGSFASGDVFANDKVGGLVGALSYSGVISSYATGHVSGVNYVGGLVGDLNAPRIVDSYSTANVTGTGDHVGGFSGYKGWRNTAYDCFWDTETSAQTFNFGTGAKGLNTSEMENPNTFINAGWDYVGESANGPSDIWIMPDGGGYPILSWQVSPLPPLPDFSGGTGVPNDPFIISTPQELNSIGHNPRLMSTHFRLGNDVNLAGIQFFPIGHEGYPFSGIFDGKGLAIRSFSHEGNHKYTDVGLFRYVRGEEAEIRDITIEGYLHRRESGESKAGLLVGMLYSGTVVNCHSQNGEVMAVAISSDDGVGGLIGYNKYGIIDGCSSSGIVQGEDFLGGLLGNNNSGLVVRCNSTATVRGNFSVGGLLGYNYAEIVDCHASGDVYGKTSGGLLGYNWHYVRACSASGNVSSPFDNVGGLVGLNVNTIMESCSYGDVVGVTSAGGLVGENVGRIFDCYARGTVSGNSNVGGLVGNHTFQPYLPSSIVSSYSTGFVSGCKNVGGFTYRGSIDAKTSDDCFWDIDTSGQTTSDGGIGKTTVEMQTAKTFLDAGWDFVGETANGTEDIWWVLEGQDYPRLWWEAAEQ